MYRREPNEPPKGGIYYIEVAKVEVRRAKKGDLMIVLDLKDVDTGRALCQDYLMLEGKGRFSGDAKLEIFGQDPTLNEADESELIGKRAYAALVVQQNDPKYEPKLAVDGKAKGSASGYWRESEPPQGYEVSGTASDLVGERSILPPDDESVPF